VRAAIDVLAELPGPRLLVLGDMGEVGDQGPAFHAEAGTYAQSKNIEKLVTIGAQSAYAATHFGAGQHFESMASLISAVLQDLCNVRSVVVKGSRFMKMEQVVEALLAHAQQNKENTCC
jgi:UDP-N-acetylmuramoyl-tripeptide--D-alanyl-D-alanine ligase